MFGKATHRLKEFRQTPRYPALIIALIGFVSFLLDYLWKPISTSGLILLGLAATPWLIRVIKLKKGKLDGWEFEVADATPPASTGARLAEEVAQAGEESVDAQLPLPQPKEEAIVPEEGALADKQTLNALLSSHEMRLARAYLAEGLVFQELQREFGGFVQREVRIGAAQIDGIIVTSRSAIAVEVKLVRDLRNWQSRVTDAAHHLLSAREMAKERHDNFSILVAVVVDNKRTPFEKSRRLGELMKMYPDLDIRVYFLPELLEKYGVSALS